MDVDVMMMSWEVLDDIRQVQPLNLKVVNSDTFSHDTQITRE